MSTDPTKKPKTIDLPTTAKIFHMDDYRIVPKGHLKFVSRTILLLLFINIATQFYLHIWG